MTPWVAQRVAQRVTKWGAKWVAQWLAQRVGRIHSFDCRPMSDYEERIRPERSLLSTIWMWAHLWRQCEHVLRSSKNEWQSQIKFVWMKDFSSQCVTEEWRSPARIHTLEWMTVTNPKWFKITGHSKMCDSPLCSDRFESFISVTHSLIISVTTSTKGSKMDMDHSKNPFFGHSMCY